MATQFECRSTRPALTLLVLGMMLLAITPNVWAQPGTPLRIKPNSALAKELDRQTLFRHSVAFIRGFDAEDEAFVMTLGVFVDAETVAVLWEGFERAARITVQPLCCEEFEATGVIGGDRDPGVLLLTVDLEGLPEEFKIQPVELAPDAKNFDIDEPVWSGSRPIGVGETAVEGFLIGTFAEEPVVSVRDMVGLGRVMQVPWDTDILMLGSPIFSEHNLLVGLSITWGGHETSLAVPADRIDAIVRHDPIDVGTYAKRKLSQSDQAERMAGIGRMHHQQGDIEEAIVAFRAASEQDEHQWRALYKLGISLDETGRAAEALSPLYESIQIEDTFAESLYSLGIVLYNLEAHSAAIHYYTKAIQLAPDYASAHGNLGAAYFMSGHLKLAAHHAQLAAGCDTERADLARMADHLAEKFDEALAKRDAQVQLVAEPGAHVDDWASLVILQFRVDAYEPCLTATESVLANAPQGQDVVLFQMMKILCLIAMERYEEALDVARQFAADDPAFAASGDPVESIGARIRLARGDLSDLLAELESAPGGDR